MQPTMLTAAIFCSALLPLFVYVSSAAAPAPVTSASSEEGNGGVDVLAFFVVALVIGVATYHVLAVTKIPYTALLIVRLPNCLLLPYSTREGRCYPSVNR